MTASLCATSPSRIMSLTARFRDYRLRDEALRTFTLDTNCLIDVEEGRPAASAILALAAAHATGSADVAVIAMSASERPKPGRDIKDFSEFETCRAVLGLAHLDTILPMAYFGISFLDHCLLRDEAMTSLEHQVHLILFPNVRFLWPDCRDNGINPLASTPLWESGETANLTFRRCGAIYMPEGMFLLRATRTFILRS